MSANYAKATQSEPRTQIASELDALEREIGLTDKIAAELHERLYAAICPRGEEASGNQPTPEPVRSPLGQAIYEQKARLERVNSGLRRLMSSLELPTSGELQNAPKARITASSMTLSAGTELR